MESSTGLIVAIAVVTLCVTLFAIYTAFGPPAQSLEDPYEMHED